jgi:hypothetical protein
MERAEAIELLGLSEDADPGEVTAAYRRLVKAAHPDSAENGDSARIQELREARDAAAQPGPSQALVTRSDLELIVRRQAEITRLAQEADATVSRVVIQHTGKLAALRSHRLTLSGLGAGIGLVLGALGAFARTDVFPELQALLLGAGAGLTICSLIVGSRALQIKSREDQLKIEIEEAGETLSDRGSLIGTLTELRLEGFFTREDLQDAIYYWSEMDNEVELIRYRERVPLSRVAAKIGPVDFARLLLAKGIESGMLVESEDLGEDGETLYGYRRAV